MGLSCSDKNDQSGKTAVNDLPKTYQEKSGKELIQMRCYACHNPVSVSHEEIIAPPMAAVKMRYSRAYPSKESFEDALVSWAMDPKPENALMWGALQRFKVMPKQEFDENEIRKIASYIYDNELPVPDWFDAHQSKMHGMGRAMRKGASW